MRHLLSVILITAFVVSMFMPQPTKANESLEMDDLFGMSMQELMDVEVESTGSLTETSIRKTPAALTIISKEDISNSGARNLFELLDIYVPNFQWIRHAWETPHMGLRGIISDRDGKYLLLVNGRIMNERTHTGAVTERDLVTLSDIHHIDVVRGPGSCLYGPGAVAMVINIITESGETFQGTEIIHRTGAIEEFYSFEIKHGQKKDDGSNLFVYGGMSENKGSDQGHSPMYHGRYFNTYDDRYVKPGQESPYSVVNDFASWRGLTKLKGYIEYNKNDWTFWARFTRGGDQVARASGAVGNSGTWPNNWHGWGRPVQHKGGYGYQQATGYIGRQIDIFENAQLDLSFSYDLLDYERVNGYGRVPTDTIAYREDEYVGKSILKWDLNDKHKIAAGFEFRHEEFGLEPLGWPNTSALSNRFSDMDYALPRFSTNMYSYIAEWQWRINDKVTTFFGGRLDDHSFTPVMFSPRGALVYTPNKKDTYKFLAARSVRTNFADEMKANKVSSGDDSEPEVLSSLEFRFERQHTDKLFLATSLFYHDIDLIGWSSPSVTNVGIAKSWGFELEAVYKTDKTRWALSHGHSKLSSFEEQAGQDASAITVKPKGYGDDLANWSNDITKLSMHHKLTKKWALDGSVRYYWGYPGKKDYATWERENGSLPPRGTVQGWEDAFRGNIYLNLGLEYKPSENLKVRFDGYNLLGLFDKELNGRPYYSDTLGSGQYRAHAAAFAVTVAYKF